MVSDREWATVVAIGERGCVCPGQEGRGVILFGKERSLTGPNVLGNPFEEDHPVSEGLGVLGREHAVPAGE